MPKAKAGKAEEVDAALSLSVQRPAMPAGASLDRKGRVEVGAAPSPRHLERPGGGGGSCCLLEDFFRNEGLARLGRQRVSPPPPGRRPEAGPGRRGGARGRGRKASARAPAPGRRESARARPPVRLEEVKSGARSPSLFCGRPYSKPGLYLLREVLQNSLLSLSLTHGKPPWVAFLKLENTPPSSFSPSQSLSPPRAP